MYIYAITLLYLFYIKLFKLQMENLWIHEASSDQRSMTKISRIR